MKSDGFAFEGIIQGKENIILLAVTSGDTMPGLRRRLKMLSRGLTFLTSGFVENSQPFVILGDPAAQCTHLRHLNQT